jgi:hypothetical protein
MTFEILFEQKIAQTNSLESNIFIINTCIPTNMSSKVKTIKPLTLEGLKDLLDYKFDPNVLKHFCQQSYDCHPNCKNLAKDLV